MDACEDLVALPVNRRAVIKASLGAGFCAAIAPALAQMITTPAEGLVAGEIKVAAGDFEIPAYHAAPERRHVPDGAGDP